MTLREFLDGQANDSKGFRARFHEKFSAALKAHGVKNQWSSIASELKKNHGLPLDLYNGFEGFGKNFSQGTSAEIYYRALLFYYAAVARDDARNRIAAELIEEFFPSSGWQVRQQIAPKPSGGIEGSEEPPGDAPSEVSGYTPSHDLPEQSAQESVEHPTAAPVALSRSQRLKRVSRRSVLALGIVVATAILAGAALHEGGLSVLFDSAIPEAEAAVHRAVEHRKNGRYDEALREFGKAAELGEAVAQAAVANMRFQGTGIAVDRSPSVISAALEADRELKRRTSSWFSRAAEAMYQRALLYLDGVGVPHDEKLGVKLLQDAIARGHSFALYSLARHYYDDPALACESLRLIRQAKREGVHAAAVYEPKFYYTGKCPDAPQDRGLALSRWRALADEGDPEAAYAVGWYYEFGEAGGDKNLAEAIAWYEKALKYESRQAQTQLGAALYDRAASKSDVDRAIRLLTQAAKQLHAPAEYMLGKAYRDGKGVEKDLKAAFEWFDRATKHGNAFARSELGWMYRTGTGVPSINLGLAKDYFEKSSGIDDGTANDNLGYMYEFGIGVEKNLNLAAKYYKSAAERGKYYSQYRMGIFLEKGISEPKNMNKAISYYEMADRGNFSDATERLGRIYRFGWGGVRRDYNKAVYYFQRLINTQKPIGHVNLGWMYFDGVLGSKNLEKAAEEFQKGIAGGVAWAQSSLAYLYLFGGDDWYDIEKAKPLCLASGNKSDECGQFCTGLIYFLEQSSNRTVTAEEAETKLLSSAEKGNKCSMILLGVGYASGEFPFDVTGEIWAPTHEDMAELWLRKSAETKFAQGQHTLAYFLHFYRHVPLREGSEVYSLLQASASMGNALSTCALVAYHNLNRDNPEHFFDLTRYVGKLVEMNLISKSEAGNALIRDGSFPYVRTPNSSASDVLGFSHGFLSRNDEGLDLQSLRP
ncbi:MAG: hypothetical protein GC191_13035 [Azospirillum sp.]|nr:hypothetical protein [Azospirillum sp.]